MALDCDTDRPIKHRETLEVRRLMQDGSSAQGPVKAGLSVAVIDRNSLFGECLCAGLQAVDRNVTFTLYDSVAMWLGGSLPPCEDPLLICLDSKEFDMLMRNENDNINRLLKAGLPTRFILLSSQDNSSYALKALQVGASAYISTSMHLAVVSQILHLVHAGGTFVPASSLQQLSTQSPGDANPSPADLSGLSPRQILVAKALRKGTPNKMIAYDLNMCESTVKVHVRHIMKKLKARNRTQVAFLTNTMFPD
jgi:DNA-binding NarL/FixJ family response regulator